MTHHHRHLYRSSTIILIHTLTSTRRSTPRVPLCQRHVYVIVQTIPLLLLLLRRKFHRSTSSRHVSRRFSTNSISPRSRVNNPNICPISSTTSSTLSRARHRRPRPIRRPTINSIKRTQPLSSINFPRGLSSPLSNRLPGKDAHRSKEQSTRRRREHGYGDVFSFPLIAFVFLQVPPPSSLAFTSKSSCSTAANSN